MSTLKQSSSFLHSSKHNAVSQLRWLLSLPCVFTSTMVLSCNLSITKSVFNTTTLSEMSMYFFFQIVEENKKLFTKWEVTDANKAKKLYLYIEQLSTAFSTAS